MAAMQPPNPYQGMTKQGAQRAIVISALLVFGIYFYRHLTEGTATGGSTSQLVGIGQPANIGRFVTAWGFVYFILALLGEAAPGLGGSLAILVAVGDLLTNGVDITKQVNKKLTAASAGPSKTTSGTSAATTGNQTHTVTAPPKGNQTHTVSP